MEDSKDKPKYLWSLIQIRPNIYRFSYRNKSIIKDRILIEFWYKFRPNNYEVLILEYLY